MRGLTHQRAGDLIEAESARLAAAITGDPGRAVPSCPDWTLHDLVHHVGEVQRFWAGRIRAAGEAPTVVDRDDLGPLDATALRAWYEACAAPLVDAVRSHPAAAPCWTWWGEPATVGAVARHQVQEAAVHRWDAERTTETAPAPIPSDAASDGVDEFLSVMLRPDAAAALTARVMLDASDTGGRWEAGPAALEPAATVRGTASDLVLLLYRRIDADDERVEVGGDVGAVVTLLEAAGT